MKNISIILIIVLILTGCKDIKQNQTKAEEIATEKAAAATKCYTVCDVSKTPDLQLVTNAEEQNVLLPDGQIDSNSYFYKKYHVRTTPLRLTQDYLTPPFYTTIYGWDSGVIVNRVRLQCLVENIAQFDSSCGNDWVFTESQGYVVGANYFFDGLFEFDTYEKGNGNNWKFLYSDFKKEFFPSVVPTQEYVSSLKFCYYDRAIQAQTGDFYYNYFRFPNHDGKYKLVIKFNPFLKGCHAVKEINYDNNEKTVYLTIVNGTVIVNK